MFSQKVKFAGHHSRSFRDGPPKQQQERRECELTPNPWTFSPFFLSFGPSCWKMPQRVTTPQLASPPFPDTLGFAEWLPKRFWGHSDSQTGFQTRFTTVPTSRAAARVVFRSFGFPEWLPKGSLGTSDLQSVCRSDFSWPQIFRRGAGAMSQPFGISEILQSCFIAAMLVH